MIKSSLQNPKSMIWASICCNDIVMGEAGSDIYNGDVLKLALSLRKQQPQAGHVYIQTSKLIHGMKSQVYELNPGESDEDLTDAICWSFMVVYEPNMDEQQAKIFLDTIIHVTEPYRENSKFYINNWNDWKEIQKILSPILVYFMYKVKKENLLADTIQTKKYIEYRAKQQKNHRHMRNKPLPMTYEYDNEFFYNNREDLLTKCTEANKQFTHIRNESLNMGYGYDTSIIQNNPCRFLENLVSCGTWY